MFSKPLFIFAHQIGVRSFYPTYKRLVKNQWRSYPELKEEQEKQLRKMISFLYDNVPYNRNLFKNLNLKPENIQNIDDLQQFPVLTDDLQIFGSNHFHHLGLRGIYSNVSPK